MIIETAGIAAAVFGLAWIRRRMQRPQTPEQRLLKAMIALHHDQRRRGLTPEQTNDEGAFRYVLARVRRRASDAVRSNPASAHVTIAAVVKEELENAKMVDRRRAGRMAPVLRDLSLMEALDEDALAKARAAYDQRAAEPITIDAQTAEDLISSATTL